MAWVRIPINIIYNKSIPCAALPFLYHWLPDSGSVCGKRMAKLVNPFS